MKRRSCMVSNRRLWRRARLALWGHMTTEVAIETPTTAKTPKTPRPPACWNCGGLMRRDADLGLVCWTCGRGEVVPRVVTSKAMRALMAADNEASQAVTRARYCKQR